MNLITWVEILRGIYILGKSGNHPTAAERLHWNLWESRRPLQTSLPTQVGTDLGLVACSQYSDAHSLSLRGEENKP